MARNQEKAQSMLYRFREAQASSLGLTPKPTRRPRLASSVTSLKECEKWRGEVIREISRKVAKIQDFGLTDFEVRDLNDEINKLLREKVHWEKQILALGGANYMRAVPSMLGGDAGIGGRGYKYFGRAKDLPGVKEMFNKTREQEEMEQSWKSDKWQRFRNLPPAYYGDEDEDDTGLLQEEVRREEEEWTQRYLQIIQGLQQDRRDDEQMDSDIEGSNGGIEVPAIPRPTPRPFREEMQALASGFHPTTSQDDSTSVEADSASAAKRQKGSDGTPLPATSASPQVAYSIFAPEDLAHPTLPDRTAVERMILNAKKRQLRQEYIGSS